MSEARILSAFWNPRQKRFVELTAPEVRQRTGIAIGDRDGRSLIARHFITRYKVQGMATNDWLFRLTPAGEARVSAMVVLGALPKFTSRALTATPQEARG
jgi:hypothetical protein